MGWNALLSRNHDHIPKLISQLVILLLQSRPFQCLLCHLELLASSETMQTHFRIQAILILLVILIISSLYEPNITLCVKIVSQSVRKSTQKICVCRAARAAKNNLYVIRLKPHKQEKKKFCLSKNMPRLVF